METQRTANYNYSNNFGSLQNTLSFFNIAATLASEPSAYAQIRGSNYYPDINGRVNFYSMQNGTLVVAWINGLPTMNNNVAIQPGAESACYNAPIFGFHIHEFGDCSGTYNNPFANAGGHYNPNNCSHPNHAGDMPPLFGNDGYAFSSFYTMKFTPAQIIGRSIIIHQNPDDFTERTSGNAGTMMACGTITR